MKSIQLSGTQDSLAGALRKSLWVCVTEQRSERLEGPTVNALAHGLADQLLGSLWNRVWDALARRRR